MRRAFPPDCVWGLVLTGFSGFLLWVAYWPVQHTALVGSGGFAWPRTILWALLVLSLVLVITGWRSRALNSAAAPEPRGHDLRRALIVAVVGAAYFASLGYIGFLLSTLVLTTILPKILGRKSWIGIMFFSLTFTTLIWLVFIRLLDLPLPKGVDIFYSFSAFLAP